MNTELEGEYKEYEVSMSLQPENDMTYHYMTSSIESIEELDMSYNYKTASIEDPFELDITSIHHTHSGSQNTGMSDTIHVLVNVYSGSQCPTGSIISNQAINTDGGYSKVVYYYSASGTFETKYLRSWYTAVSRSYGLYYSRSLEPVSYQIDDDSSRNNSRYIGSKLIGADINVDSAGTSDGGPVVVVIESNPNNIFIKEGGDDGNLLVE